MPVSVVCGVARPTECAAARIAAGEIDCETEWAERIGEIHIC